MDTKSPRIEISCHQVLWGVTPRARLIRFDSRNKARELWVPKSLVEFEADPGEHNVGDIPGRARIPEWLARKEGII